MENAINTIVTEQGLKQIDKLIVSLEKAELQMDKSIEKAVEFNKQLGTPPKTSGALNKQLKESQDLMKQLQTDYKRQESALASLQKKYEALATAKKAGVASDRQSIIDNREIRKELDGQAIANSNLTSYIQKLSVERQKASRIVADYNAQVALGTALTEEQSAELAQATASFQKYDNAIKAGKKSIGDAREYVGQYERANLGLTNSVNQIVRELPSATFGIQTFFLAISNNIPIMVDEVNRAVEVNKKLGDSGEKITPVWKQVSSALFSFNGIMSAGLLILALWGKEIGEATSKLFGFETGLSGANKQLDLLNQQTDEFNSLSVEAVGSYEKQYNRIKQLIAVMKDETKGDLDRKSAKEEILSLYPGYFKSMSDEQKLLSNLKDGTSTYSQALNKLTSDIKKRTEAEAKAKSAQETLKLSAEIEKEIELRERVNTRYLELWNKYGEGQERLTKRERKEITEQISNRKELLDEDATFVEKFGKIAVPESGSVSIIGTYATAQIETLREQSKTLLGLYKTQQEEVNALFVETSLLDVKDTKNKDENTRAIKLNTKAREDYLASEYELWRLRKQNESDRNKEIMNDEASGYELRLMASEQYYANELDLANRAAQEELRILAFATEDRKRVAENEFTNSKEKLDTWLKDKKISNEDYNKGIKDAEEQLQYDRNGIIKDATNQQNIIYENQAQKLVDANRELVGKLEQAWNEINFSKADILIDERSLKGFEDLGKLLKGIGEDMPIGEIKTRLAEINRLQEDNNRTIRRAELQVQLDRIEAEKRRVENAIITDGKLNNLSEEQIDRQKINNKELLSLDDQIIKKKEEIAKADNEVTQVQIDNALKLKEAKLEAQMELGQELGNLANQLFENTVSYYDREIEKSNEYYDALLENAESGSEQEKALQEEKERRENELQRRKVAIQRKQAIFNKLLSVAEIAFNLQQEISKNNATLGTVLAQPVNALAVASSAIRVATVLATPLPQYKDGRKGGKAETALIAEGMKNGKFVPEVVTDSQGNNPKLYTEPSIVKLNQGDIVHKSLEDFNKNRLAIQNASIMASFGRQGKQMEIFDYYIGKEFRGISNKIERGIEKGFKKAKINNNFKAKIDIDHWQYRNKGFNA